MSEAQSVAGFPHRVLIVDDDPAQLDSLQGLVSLSGYDAEVAGGGQMALELLDSQEFDLVLLDLHMPGMSGFDVIEHITKRQYPCKVIVVSGDANFESARKALRWGAHDFVKKPYLPDELFTTLNNAVSRLCLERDHRTIKEKFEESEYLHRFIVEHSPDLVFMLDSDGRFTFLNDAVLELLGYSTEELLGRHYSILVAGQSVEQAKYVFMERRSGERKSRNVELKLKCRDESECRYFDMTSMAVSLNHADGGEGPFVGTYGVGRDITDRKRAEELIQYQAHHDLLTRLPNRALLEDRLTIAINQAKRGQQQLAVMFIDLDRFKTVNDSMGHSMGDTLLQFAAQRLESCLRKGDTLARFGGDEFALVLPQIRRREDAEIIAKKLLEVLKPPFVIDDNDVYISGSIGIAVYPEAGHTRDVLIRSADLAMYSVKGRGKNGYEFFKPEMNQMNNIRFKTERELRQALAGDQLRVYYQPQVNAETEQVIGLEALVRWEHPGNGRMYPGDFIPVAEETGLIIELGNFVLERVCLDLKHWREAGLDNVRVAINFSATQVEQEDFIDRIVAELEKNQLPGSCLEVEITEHVIMADMNSMNQKLARLNSVGVNIAIDDFGTGYSSLSYLQQFPINTLKIDKSFISSINVSESATSIVNAIVAMAKGLKLNLVAEGVENNPQLEYLKELGCAGVQGWLFGKAEDAAHTYRLLEQMSNGGTIRPIPEEA